LREELGGVGGEGRVRGSEMLLKKRNVSAAGRGGNMKEDDQRFVLGIDLGGTKILSAVIDAEGRILSRDQTVTPAAQGLERVLEAMKASGDRALTRIGKKGSEISAVGIGAPGPSNPGKGIIFTSPNLPGWDNVPITTLAEQLFNRRVFLINDANAAALAEHRFGSGRGTSNLVYITVSTGIGGGIIIGGKLYAGAIGTAGELGHMTINDKGPLCNCGNYGCWEALASGTAIARQARIDIDKGTKTLVRDLVSGDLEKVSAEVVRIAAAQGDSMAKELISQTGYYLGVGLANLINIFNPELIVIGGGVSNMGDMLLAPAFETAGKKAYRAAFDAVRFTSPELGGDSGVLGAAVLALEAPENHI
jgi:glucokinase